MWLKKNKHVKVVTRDRASAYAKVIAEKLPDAMQVADRLYLHQNLLEAIKKVLNREFPVAIMIPHDEESTAHLKSRVEKSRRMWLSVSIFQRNVIK